MWSSRGGCHEKFGTVDFFSCRGARGDTGGGREHRLTSRTPWVFVLDPGNVILAEGHGSRIKELVSVLDPMTLAGSEQ